MSDSRFLKHVPCPSCGSSDSGALYTDGHVFCFGRCRKIVSTASESLECCDEDERSCAPAKKYLRYEQMNQTDFQYKGIPDRGITKDTCEKYGVRVFSDKHEYPYFNGQSQEVATKIRFVKDKKFSFPGDQQAALLFGQHLFHGGGKFVTVCEGELDALSAYQMTGSQWPVVSIPTGADGSEEACKKEAVFKWLDSFEAIVVCFDEDGPGQRNAKKIAALFTGKAKIMKMAPDGFKDASDYLQAGATKAFVNAWWRAEDFKPEGIVTVADVKESLLAPPQPGVPWCFPTLTKLTYGRRYGELYAFGAGVGVGKTDFFTQQIAYDISVLDMKVGVIYLEQPVKETVQRIAGKINGKRFHKPDGGWTQQEYLEAVEDLEKRDQLYMMQHFGAKDWATVKQTMRYMVKRWGIKSLYLDHLTALAAVEQDERRGLDFIMADMAGMAQEDGFFLHFISHLTTPEGTPHEEGGRVRAKHFTGSRAIARWAHSMYGLERDTLAEDPVKRQTTTLRFIKDRFLGDGAGELLGLRYDKYTGMMSECTLETEPEAL